MLARDTYSDYLTDEELADDTTGLLPAERIAHLRRRSGMSNVTNGRLTVSKDINVCAFVMHISFDSRAWTGR